MTERLADTVIQSCIDFRFSDQVKNHQRENQAHLMATPGASLNPSKLINTLKTNPIPTQRVINLDHEDCGAYKITGDDGDLAHQRNMDKLQKDLQSINPRVEYTPLILRLDPKYHGEHHCPATAIILGTPEVLMVAFERLEQENLSGKHDIIARPFNLNDHESLLEDLEISAKLHRPKLPKPFTVFIFDQDEDNAMILEKKVAQTVKGAKVETIIVSAASQEESVA